MNLFSVPDKRGYRGVLEKSGTDGTVSEVRVTRKLRVASGEWRDKEPGSRRHAAPSQAPSAPVINSVSQCSDLETNAGQNSRGD